MLEGLLSLLACPVCASGSLRVTIDSRWKVGGVEEVRDGQILCGACGRGYPIGDGIVDLLADPPREVIEEIEGNRKMVLTDRRECDDDWLLGLPGSHAVLRSECADHDEMADFLEIAARVDATTHPRLLDLGAGTCWTTDQWAQRGFQAVGSDISLDKYVGLSSAEVFIKVHCAFFERLRFDMNGRWPFRDASLDVVVAMSSIHHSLDIARCFREAARVLKGSGIILLVEVTRSAFVPEGKTGFGQREREEFHWNEHIYSQGEYAWAGGQAGFDVSFYAAGSYKKKLDMVYTRTGFEGRTGLKHRLAYAARPLLGSRLVRRALTGSLFAVVNWLFGTQFIGVGRRLS